MKKTWINFSIKGQAVYKVEYNGCMGQDRVDMVKSMVAIQNRVDEKDINISFSEELTQKRSTLKTSSIVSSKVVAEVSALIQFRMNLN